MPTSRRSEAGAVKPSQTKCPNAEEEDDDDDEDDSLARLATGQGWSNLVKVTSVSSFQGSEF
jgi:hypothetical protein